MAGTGTKRAAIDISTNTTTTIITTNASEYFNIMKIFLHSSGTNGVTFKSGSTVICGKLDLVAQERFIQESCDTVPWYSGIAAGDDFTITTTASVQLSGTVVYTLTT